jgi:hypothetical protein
MMSFGDAIHYLKFGVPERKVGRLGWNGKGMWVALQRPDFNSKMGLPYLYMSTVDGKLVPWVISQTDALTDDWDIVE